MKHFHVVCMEPPDKEHDKRWQRIGALATTIEAAAIEARIEIESLQRRHAQVMECHDECFNTYRERA